MAAGRLARGRPPGLNKRATMLLPQHLYYLGAGDEPWLDLMDNDEVTDRVVMLNIGPGRTADENVWRADLRGSLPAADSDPGEREWQFRIDRGDGHLVHPLVAECFTTALQTVWVQDDELFAYRPAPEVSPPRVVKIDEFVGSLPTRPLYVNLPRGFNEHPERRYPVIYMQDGQNCFEAFVADSYVGAWQADVAAEFLIGQGLMQECIVVGVSHGQEDRMLEYLPPYAAFTPPSRRPFVKALTGENNDKPLARPIQPQAGRADKTVRYYQDEIAPYLEQHYRALQGRENRATCGSSMGGLFAVYTALEHPEFARNHAALSSSFWITRTRDGKLEMIERMRTGPRQDIRLWLDSGTRSAPNRGDDGMRETLKARDALLEAGYVPGVDFQYFLDEGGIHNEASWAARLPMIFQFLFPAT